MSEPSTAPSPSSSPDWSFDLLSEFGWVRVSLDTTGRGPRCRVENLESGDVVFLDAIELASMCQSTDTQRREWLRTGPYTPVEP